jgi:predicted O-methyltransferase YrrM
VAGFEDIWRKAQTIDGWLTEDQARRLYIAARQVPPTEAIVEIGSHHGRSTVILGSAKRPGVGLTAVDPYDDPRWGGGEEALGVFGGNLAACDLLHEVELIRSYGVDAGRTWHGRAVGLLFVDGAHDYQSVLADLRAWLPHLSTTALVAMHDAYSSPGVTRAAFRVMFGSDQWRYQGSSRSLACFRYADLPSPTAAAWSSIGMLSRVPWLARNLTIKIAIRQGWLGLSRLLGHHDASVMPY